MPTTRAARQYHGRVGAHAESRHVGAAAWTVVAALIVAYLVVFGVSAAARLARPVEFMYGEAVVLEIVRRVAQGEALYPATDHAPFLVTAYTPLYYLIVGGLQRIFGDSYMVGRLVSLAATLGAAAALALSARLVTDRWLPAGLAAGLFLTQNMTALLWAPLHRVDLLALFLTHLGLLFATRGHARLAALPLLLAVLTKQTYLVAPVAVCIALWPDRRAILGFGVPFAVGLGLAVAVAQHLTGGWFVWHTVLANANPFDEGYLRTILASFVHFNGLPLLAAALLFALPSRPGERVWRAYYLALVPTTLATVGKLGASSNYWLELTAATAVLLAILAARLVELGRARSPITELVLPTMLIGALLVGIPGYQAVVHEARRVLPVDGNVWVKAQLGLAPLIAAEPFDVLTDEPALAVAAGRRVELEFMIFSLLAGSGFWDERPVLAAIKARRYGLVVLSRPLDIPPEQARWTTAMAAALKSSYAPAGQQDGYWLYRPKDTPPGMPVLGAAP